MIAKQPYSGGVFPRTNTLTGCCIIFQQPNALFAALLLETSGQGDSDGILGLTKSPERRRNRGG